MWLDSMNPLPQSHGMSYFLGVATRLINDFEDFFKADRRVEARFEQQGLTGKVNGLFALESPDGKRALVLLFNQSDKPATVTVTLKDNSDGWKKVTQREGEGKNFQRADNRTMGGLQAEHMTWNVSVGLNSVNSSYPLARISADAITFSARYAAKKTCSD